MIEKIKPSKYVLATLALVIVMSANILVWQNQWLGVIVTGLYLFFYSFIAGRLISLQRGWQIFFGLLLLVSLIIIFGALSIYLYQFNTFVALFFIILLPAILFIPYYKAAQRQDFNLKETLLKYLDNFLTRKEQKINFSLIIIYLALIITGLNLLFNNQTTQSIQSPFQIVTPRFIILYFVSTLILLTYVFLSKRSKLPLLLICIHTFFSTAIAAIVYQIGYGYDPFIHQAAEKIINSVGSISPKTPYYLGQYGLVLFLHKLTLLNIEFIDKWLVILFGSISLPLATYYALSNWLKKNFALILSGIFLIIPFTGLIMTTPQNLANIFFIVTVLSSLPYLQNKLNLSFLVFLTAATLAIHPMAGIPLAITIFLIWLFKTQYQNYSRHIFFYLLTAASLIVILPLAFIANGSQLKFTFPEFHRSDLIFFHWVDKFDIFLNLTFLINFNLALLAGLIVATGIIYLQKNKLFKNYLPYITAALVLIADYFLIKYFVNFPALRDFDLPDFIGRLAWLAFYCLLPLFFIGSYLIIKNVWQRDVFSKFLIIFGLSGLMSISLYLSYPEINQYVPTKFFSLSSSDIKAVNLIEQIAKPNHVVLANQMVGAAVIKEFGFKKYFDNEFFYSMPNGGSHNLYNYYLDMIYNNNKIETVAKALNDTGADEVYFVLNKYWNNSDKIAQQVTNTAEQVYDIDNGQVLIYKYSKTQESL